MSYIKRENVAIAETHELPALCFVSPVGVKRAGMFGRRLVIKHAVSIDHSDHIRACLRHRR